MTPTRFLAVSAKALANRLRFRHGFLKCRSGTTAIEFAMISVPFIGLLGAIFETGSLYFRSAQLQNATEAASRPLLTHSIGSTLTNENFVKNYLCTWKTSGVVKPNTLSTMFDCDKVMVKVDNMNGTWSTVDASGADIYNNPPTSGANITLPAAGQIAVVRVVYPMASIFNILAGGVFSGQGVSPVRAGYVSWQGGTAYMLVGMYAFRVEP